MSLIFAMCLFSFSMSISPGPVNVLTLSTGVNYGFKKTMPFVSGATFGFTLLLLVVGLGLRFVAELSEIFLSVLTYIGAMFIAYMGIKLASSVTTSIPLSNEKQDIPAFSDGFLLQWLNPKAWIACISGVSAFNLAYSLPLLSLFICLYFLVCYISIASWALLGDKINALLNTPSHFKLFNVTMGGSLIIVACYLVYLQIIV
ncbi:MAG: threonine/homoserine/homoserine lactone efflux protein [Alteromonadaceae bacterium]|jgi:threonine/homoserine/homoserine lactone efflux protein